MLAYVIKVLRSDRLFNVTNNVLEKLGAATKVSKIYKVKLRRQNAEPESCPDLTA